MWAVTSIAEEQGGWQDFEDWGAQPIIYDLFTGIFLGVDLEKYLYGTSSAALPDQQSKQLIITLASSTFILSWPEQKDVNQGEPCSDSL